MAAGAVVALTTSPSKMASNQNSITENEIGEYREMIEELGTFPVRTSQQRALSLRAFGFDANGLDCILTYRTLDISQFSSG